MNIHPFFAIHSSGDDAGIVIADLLSQLQQAPAGCNLGFIYASDLLAERFAELLEHCKHSTGVEHWVGSLGVGIIANDQEFYDQPAACLMLCRFDEGSFNILHNSQNPDELRHRISGLMKSSSCLALVHADAYNPDTQEMIHTLGNAVENCFSVGGLTSSRTQQLQVADTVASGGLSGVILDDSIEVLTSLTQGCSPLGTKHVITEARDNIVISLDHKPALDVLQEDIGEILARDLEQAAWYIFAGLCVPYSDQSDYTVRNLVGLNEDERIFAINDHLTEGAELLICRRDGNTAVDDMQRMLDMMKKRLKTPPRGGIYVSCLGRGREQFGENSEEVRMIHNTLGEFPLCGFFANGEIHHNRLYGYTGVLTLFA